MGGSGGEGVPAGAREAPHRTHSEKNKRFETIPTPNYHWLKGCAALGGVTTTCSPRCLNTNENLTLTVGRGCRGFCAVL